MRKFDPVYTFGDAWDMWRSVAWRGAGFGTFAGGLFGFMITGFFSTLAIIPYPAGFMFGVMLGIVSGAIDGAILAVVLKHPNFRPDMYTIHRVIFCALSALIASAVGMLYMLALSDRFLIGLISLVDPKIPMFGIGVIAAVSGCWSAAHVLSTYGSNGKAKRKKE